MPESSSSSSSSSFSSSSSSASLAASEPFCTEYDLAAERPAIMNYGISNWDDKINEAAGIVIRDLDLNWYRGAADNFDVDWRYYPFDVELVYNSPSIKRLAVYKTLEAIYRFLRKDTPADQDGFEPQMKIYAKLYKDELQALCASGIDYDWDASGGITSEETKQPSQRRLNRC